MRTTAIAMAIISAVPLSGCGGDDQDEALRRRAREVGHPIATASTAVTTTTEAGSEFSRRLAAVRAGDLTLGESFNRQFLGVQLQAVGLDASESTCVADRIAAAAGDRFASTPVGQLGTGATPSPDALLACVPADRVAALARSPRPDLARVPPDVLRSTLSALAVAGYESAGLVPAEADCLAAHVVGTYADEDLASVMTDLSLPADRAVAGLRSCVTADRANQLGA